MIVLVVWGRESNLGIEIGEREGDVGERGNSVRWAGVFFACCGGGIIWSLVISFFSLGYCWEGV